MKQCVCAAVFSFVASQALAQSTGAPSSPTARSDSRTEVGIGLGTPLGQDVGVTATSYTYKEPDAPGISIHGPKIGGEYRNTVSIGAARQRVFAQLDVRGSVGHVTYDGACAPWLIVPNSASPNGYALDLGDFSPCSETGDKDWSADARALVGKDFIGQWGLSPFSGIGFRHLSNGTTGLAGYRTDEYLYLPLGITARSRVASRGTLSLNLEYDRLLHGWQNTRDSALGGGDVPATSTAPRFSIDSFTDISFAQGTGWAVRASATYQSATRWSVTPYFIHWTVGASSVSAETVAFTVNGVSASQQLGAYEPDNLTNEFGVTIGWHF